MPRRRRGEGGGKEGAGGAVQRILGGSRGFQAKLGQTVDNRLPMMGGGGGRGEIIQILRRLEGLGGLCCKILRPTSTPPPLPLLEIRNDWSLSMDKRVFTTLGGTFALTLS